MIVYGAYLVDKSMLLAQPFPMATSGQQGNMILIEHGQRQSQNRIMLFFEENYGTKMEFHNEQ